MNTETQPITLYHIPKIGTPAFTIPVPDAFSGALLLTAVTHYVRYQEETRQHPFSANAGGIFIVEDGQELDWSDPETDEPVESRYMDHMTEVQRVLMREGAEMHEGVHRVTLEHGEAEPFAFFVENTPGRNTYTDAMGVMVTLVGYADYLSPVIGHLDGIRLDRYANGQWHAETY